MNILHLILLVCSPRLVKQPAPLSRLNILVSEDQRNDSEVEEYEMDGKTIYGTGNTSKVERRTQIACTAKALPISQT
jgi:hypothetical protein